MLFFGKVIPRIMQMIGVCVNTDFFSFKIPRIVVGSLNTKSIENYFSSGNFWISDFYLFDSALVRFSVYHSMENKISLKK